MTSSTRLESHGIPRFTKWKSKFTCPLCQRREYQAYEARDQCDDRPAIDYGAITKAHFDERHDCWTCPRCGDQFTRLGDSPTTLFSHLCFTCLAERTQ